MQEQQLLQQQIYQQRLQQQPELHVVHNSPPPGYRSTLDVHVTPSTSSTTNNAAGIINNNTSHDNLSGSCNNSSCAGSINANGNGSSYSNFFGFNRQNATTNSKNGNNAAVLNMKKVLSAQSCCSLQRAEVENMWNAAAAAVAARAIHASHPTTTNADNENGSCVDSLAAARPGNTPPMLLARKSLPLPLTLPVKFASNAVGRRCLPQNSNYYRRGCPLCGKFRYDPEETLSLSVESGLDAPTITMTEQAATTLQSFSELRLPPAGCDYGDYGDTNLTSNANATVRNDDTKEEHIGMMIKDDDEDENENGDGDEDGDECYCAYTMGKMEAALPTQSIAEIDNDNNNNNNSIDSTFEKSNQQPLQNITDQNANQQHEMLSTTSSTDATDNDNTATTSAAAIAATTATTEAAGMPRVNTLDAINANGGIIRVDMSKIIDQTGLPTYEAALKLESSGYV